MQHKKSNIKKKILDAAAREFDAKGFYKTNIRDVVAEADTSIGNLYLYFGSKDDLFGELVKPTIDSLEVLIKKLRDEDYYTDAYKWGLEWHQEFMVLAARFIDRNRRNLNLLFFKSQGSKLETYKQRFVERYTDLSIEMVRETQERFPEYGITLSDFFIRCHVSFNINLVGEILRHNIAYEKMLEYFQEIVTYEYHGFKPLMGDYKFIPFLRKN